MTLTGSLAEGRDPIGVENLHYSFPRRIILRSRFYCDYFSEAGDFVSKLVDFSRTPTGFLDLPSDAAA